MKRIVLGTAQLSGFAYGNLKRGLTRQESYAILDAAWELGIRTFDTAESYGAAADRLESWLRQQPRHDARVTTKVTPGAGLQERARGAANRFFQQLDTVYLHGLPQNRHDGNNLKLGAYSYGGASIYTLDDARVVRACGTPTRWHVPLHTYRIGDWTEPCDVRSVFDGGANVFNPLEQLVAALDRLRPQDRLVIGVDTPKQLEVIADACAL